VTGRPKKPESTRLCRARLWRKHWEALAWDWKEDPRRYVRAFCRSFEIRPDVTALDSVYPERLLGTIAQKHRLHLYDMHTLEDADAYGFILAGSPLTHREIQQIEAWYWGEAFDEVYSAD
jgi:hypothetical protein